MHDNLHIDQLRKILVDRGKITTMDIYDFYRYYNPDIPFSTVRWRIHELIKGGILHKVGYGRYQLGEKDIFLPNIYRKTQDINRHIRRHFPYINFCQWDLAVANAFAQHMLNIEVYFVDVERDATESVYYEIRERYPRTILSRNIRDELSYYDGYIVIRNLISSAPVVITNDLPMAAIEKILVDFAVDSIFPFHNIEILRIFDNAMSRYTVNISKMLRYAGRRGKREEIEEILDTIKQ